MVQETVQSMRNCGHCIQFEARLQKPGLKPIICTELMDLVHIDYVKMEVTLGLKGKPEVRRRVGSGRPLHPLPAGICHKESQS